MQQWRVCVHYVHIDVGERLKRSSEGRSRVVTRGFISTTAGNYHCAGVVTPRGTFARHAFDVRATRRARVPIIGKATSFFNTTEFLHRSPRVKAAPEAPNRPRERNGNNPKYRASEKTIEPHGRDEEEERRKKKKKSIPRPGASKPFRLANRKTTAEQNRRQGPL
ncbi:hypothetical protein ANTQUA_LOCUS3127 [Anthophora quadrimaculata]